MTQIVARDEAVWSLIQWGSPDQRVAEECSICDAPLPDESVPIRLFNGEGWGAAFCDTCFEKWFRVAQ